MICRSKMRQLILRILACVLTGAVALDAAGQIRDQQMRLLVDSMLSERYYRSPYDTNYVVRPEGRLTLKVRMNQSGNSFHAKGTVNGIYSRADLSTSHKTTFSVAGIYRGIGIGMAINPAKWKGVYKDYELNLNYYSSRLSLDFSYQRSESLAGDIRRDPLTSSNGMTRGELLPGDATLKVANLAGYYSFNHRRFSFPAAFTQSYIQLRSAGSWLAGISYQGGSIRTTEKLKERGEQSAAASPPDVRIYVGHVGIGGGYGYNWVLGRKWLLHFSMLPTFVVYNRNNMTINGERKKAEHMRFNMIFNERAAIVHYFSGKGDMKSTRYFAGITLAMNNSIFDDDVVVVNQNKWRVRAFLGLRLF